MQDECHDSCPGKHQENKRNENGGYDIRVVVYQRSLRWRVIAGRLLNDIKGLTV